MSDQNKILGIDICALRQVATEILRKDSIRCHGCHRQIEDCPKWIACPYCGEEVEVLLEVDGADESVKIQLGPNPVISSIAVFFAFLHSVAFIFVSGMAPALVLGFSGEVPFVILTVSSLAIWTVVVWHALYENRGRGLAVLLGIVLWIAAEIGVLWVIVL